MVRQMGDFKVLQRTSDGMFNATTLLKQWNQKMGMKKEIGDYFDNGSTKEFIKTIVERENLHTGNSPYVKSRASRGNNAGTWMHPLLYIDFAMWINPSFKYDVLRFVSDQLIKYRNEAGDAYKDMCVQVDRIRGNMPTKDAIKTISRFVNITIYGKHEREIRNKVGEESKARDLLEIERDIAKLIKKGFIRNLSELREYLLTEYRDRHEPKLIIA